MPRVSFVSHRYLRLLLIAVGIVACLFGIRAAAAFGVSRILTTYSLVANDLGAGRRAVSLTPKDAEAHFATGALLSISEDPQRAVNEIELAVALRPADYRIWQQLGLLRDQFGDAVGALAAFDEAVKRAPFYSRPRWNRGNVLLRSGNYDPAFADLNQAAKSNPEMVPSLIDLAWGVSRGDVAVTEQLAQIDSDKMRIAFARFLARRGKAKEALAQFTAVANVPETINREIVEQLLAKGAFSEAFQVWNAAHGSTAGREPALPSLYDGGFEGTLEFAAGGFGWRVPRDIQATTVSLDSVQPHSGARNLRIEFGGNSNAAAPVVSQLMLVEPSKRYKVNFAGRSQDIVTGGLPLVVVNDTSAEQKRLGQSPPLSKTRDWQVFSFEFATPPAANAVVISLQRENCTSSPCPIFGSISLDSFSVEELK